ncbi:phosphatase PAP2 family protein [Halioxenophilus sp. WMMB6]|uniref:phosphatase PAP2 family protein n=1 Tax=Halioxenophilus sp. WMMB6 TaxID=3073815 RepID=UPI00295E688F|nr:phosphatase PAP2 family protein [Halioxenophilus sp. WMMB6]
MSHQLRFDEWLEAKIYTMEGGGGSYFPWRDNFWLYDVMHQKGRSLVKKLFFLNLLLLLLSLFVKRLARYKSIFLFILLSTLFSTSIISFLKHHTTIPCPESLIEFGGTRHWINIWQVFEQDLPIGKCYPAGHASSGYAWLCLAFLFPPGSRKFYLSLLPGALLGLSFGIAQQFRGAHFISHDLLTIAICWLISGAFYHLLRNIPGWYRAVKYHLCEGGSGQMEPTGELLE